MKYILFAGAALAVAFTAARPAAAQDEPCSTIEECAQLSVEIAKSLSERQAAIEARLGAQAATIAELTASLEAEQAASQTLTGRVAQLEACAVKTDELRFALSRNETTGPMRHDLGAVPDTATIWFSKYRNGPWWLMDSVADRGGYGTWLIDATDRTVRFSSGPRSATSSYGRRHHGLFIGTTEGGGYLRVILTARAENSDACEAE